jgi:hypothetical protein
LGKKRISHQMMPSGGQPGAAAKVQKIVSVTERAVTRAASICTPEKLSKKK